MKDELTKLQFDVTQNCSTEPPFENEFWDNKDDGIYVDIISGKPLFCSIHKYDSGTGWPSFYNIIEDGVVKKSDDFNLGYKRIELNSTSFKGRGKKVAIFSSLANGKRLIIGFPLAFNNVSGTSYDRNK